MKKRKERERENYRHIFEAYKYLIGGSIGVHVSTIVFEVLTTTSSHIFFVFMKRFCRTKTRHKLKPFNKTKTSKHETTKTIVRAKSFHKKNNNNKLAGSCPDNLKYYTT